MRLHHRHGAKHQECNHRSLLTCASLQFFGRSNMIAIMSGSLIDHLVRLTSRTRMLTRGDHLFHRGDPIVSLYLIEHGEVHLQRFTAAGGAAVMQRAAAGALLAEASIFSEHYHCDALAADAVTARQFDMRDIRALMERDPAFTASLAEHLAQEVMRMRSRCEIAALRTVEARLDGWLALHDNTLPPAGKRVELAREIGVSAEALYRELARRRMDA
jgi:CRP-like cAMP-binding protein